MFPFLFYIQIPQNIIGNYTSDTAIQYFESYATGGSDIDTSIDVFNFNFLGNSGKFVLDENKNIVLLNPNGLKIEMTNGFVITDQLGIKYFFSATESSMSRSYGQGHDVWSLEAITAWYLTKIVHPKGDENEEKALCLDADLRQFWEKYLLRFHETGEDNLETFNGFRE